MKKIAFLFIISLFLTCCKKNDIVTFSGELTGAEGHFITVSRLNIGEVVQSDSVQVTDGRFSLTLTVTDNNPAFYRISLNKTNAFTTLATRGDKIHIAADASSLVRTYHATGTPDALLMNQLDNQLALFADSIAVLTALYEQYIETDTMRVQIETAYIAIKTHHSNFLRQFIQDNPQSFSCLAAFYQRYNQCIFLPEDENWALLQQIYQQLNKLYPTHTNVTWLQQRLSTKGCSVNL